VAWEVDVVDVDVRVHQEEHGCKDNDGYTACVWLGKLILMLMLVYCIKSSNACCKWMDVRIRMVERAVCGLGS
jgi:hypothetical protein